MSIDFHVVIPARYASHRCPGKLLMLLGGQTVLARVYAQAKKAGAATITIATDHAFIAEEATRLGAQVIMTSDKHPSGTDRVAEAVEALGLPADAVIVNVQGDEPLMPPALIRQVAQSLVSSSQTSMATLCAPIQSEEDYISPNCVKVIRNAQNKALYFSRSPIPAFRDGEMILKHVFRHIGLYAYRKAFLLDMVTWPVCPLEAVEALEQLRVLWSGHAIQVDEACVAPRQDINTLDDLKQAEALILNE
ncbi:MAG: 3-deoxy-manno-octulosonate cytidylyltransferase [Legionella sp.]|nr:3-deoxy-manno-octulosonate cytidylyltransferase [Legionella sp.]